MKRDANGKQCIVKPKILDFLKYEGIMAVDVACGVKHTALITKSSHLITFGSNQFGQCGIEETGPDAVKNNFYTIDVRGHAVEMVACGALHTLVLGTKDNSQCLFAFGNNSDGQLGLESGEIDKVKRENFLMRTFGQEAPESDHIFITPSRVQLDCIQNRVTWIGCSDQTSAAVTVNN